MCPINFDRMKQKPVKSASRSWKPKEGANRIRILPVHSRYVGEDHSISEDLGDFAYEYRSHYFDGDGVVRCPRDHNQFCVACGFYEQFKHAADPVLKKAADQIEARRSYVANIFDMGAPQAGVQVFRFGWMVWKQLQQYAVDLNWGNIMDVGAAGHCYIITLTTSGKNSSFKNYHVQPEPRPRSIASMLPPDWKQKIDLLEDSIIPKVADDAEMRDRLRQLGLPDVTTPVAPVAPPTAAALPPLPPNISPWVRVTP
jgi:hypothetical protein